MRGEEEQCVLHSTFTPGQFSPESKKGDVKLSLLKINNSWQKKKRRWKENEQTLLRTAVCFAQLLPPRNAPRRVNAEILISGLTSAAHNHTLIYHLIAIVMNKILLKSQLVTLLFCDHQCRASPGLSVPQSSIYQNSSWSLPWTVITGDCSQWPMTSSYQ